MRVTENTNFETVRGTLSRSRERLSELQQQSATLKKMNVPSDDPVGSAKLLELKTDKANNDQYQMNSKLAQAMLDNTDHILTDLSELIARAKEIAINQSSTINSSEEARRGVAEEVHQLYLQALSVANRRVGERYLLGGYQTQKPPVDNKGHYHGDDGQMMVEIANDVFIATNLPGSEVFNTQPNSALGPSLGPQEPRSDEMIEENENLNETRHRHGDGHSDEFRTQDNVNLFNAISRLKVALLTGDMDSVHDSLDRFDQIYGKLVSLRAKIGSRIQGLEAANKGIERHNLTNASLSSSIEDADMTQVVSDLGKEETVFKSALASSKKLVQPTLLDFLR